MASINKDEVLRYASQFCGGPLKLDCILAASERD
jgi:hypothetical protein